MVLTGCDSDTLASSDDLPLAFARKVGSLVVAALGGKRSVAVVEPDGPASRSASDGAERESQSFGSSDVIDPAPKIELFNRDVIVRTVENLATGAQCLDTGNCGTAKPGPRLRTIEGLVK